jgi:Macrocin-O-methyltransferase (TylF)
MDISFKRVKHLLSKKPDEIVRRVFDSVYFGMETDSFNIDKMARLSAAVSSANYASVYMLGAEKFRNNFELIDYACERLKVPGLKLEFGVWSGSTINRLAQHFSDNIFGFDSFEGLPEDWRPGFEKGRFATTNLPTVRNNVKLVIGWFDKTLPNFIEQNSERVALLHIDCDLYSSTKTVFDCLGDKIDKGTILIFDEYFNYPGWESGEHKAFQEYITSKQIKYKYIGYVPNKQQVAVEIESVGDDSKGPLAATISASPDLAS